MQGCLTIPSGLHFRSGAKLLENRLICVFVYIYIFRTLLLSRFWTSRGHRCRPFSPPVLAFNFYRA